MVNIKMVFYHPKYYKELRKRNKLDQAISDSTSCSGADSVRPDPGLKLSDSTMVKQRASSSTSRDQKQQASSSKLRYTPTGILLGVDLGPKPKASSSKQQTSSKPEPEPSSGPGSQKPQATSSKLQASSHKR